MKKAFTLLELIIVIIIVGVLTSLAIPALFSSIDMAHNAEAYAALGTIRAAVERCRYRNHGAGINCKLNDDAWLSGGNRNNTLDIPDPSLSPGSHFDYVSFANNEFHLFLAKRPDVPGCIIFVEKPFGQDIVHRCGTEDYAVIGNCAPTYPQGDWACQVYFQGPFK